MEWSELFRATPWDKRVWEQDTYEITTDDPDMIRAVVNLQKVGHYTIKVDPLWDKKVLLELGFYYADTLIEPICHRDRFVGVLDSDYRVDYNLDIEELVAIAFNAFEFGRFDRDPYWSREQSNQRYAFWLRDLYRDYRVFGLYYQNSLAGFWGCIDHKIVLHALSSNFRSKGMGKFFWTVGCLELFNLGYQELVSSISASNLAVLNLYSGLGFRFQKAIDVYHLVI